MKDVYILSGARTPLGSFMGQLSTVSAPRLAAETIKESVKKAAVDPKDIQATIMGNVVQAGVGQAPARQAAIFAGLGHQVPCVTVNKVCGSGLQTIIQGARQIALNDVDLLVAGGMENMSLSPHFIPSSRVGHKFGATQLVDAMQWDGLWDVYSDRPMGNCAEECAREFNLSRQAQDEFAKNSFQRSQKAMDEGVFVDEIVPITVKQRKHDVVVSEDEGPRKAQFDKMAKLKPAFTKDGTITAANASTINDGAASVVLGGKAYQDRAAFRIVSYASHAHDPTWFTTAPVEAIKKSLDSANLKIEQIDLFEINEAFSLVPMVVAKQLELSMEKINIYGGAVSLGHPIGCSGTRIVVTLMNALKREQKRYGCAAICIGGGEGLSLIIERLK